MDTYMTECVRVCVCVRMCVRACVRACVCVCVWRVRGVDTVYLCIFMSGCHLLDLHRIPTFPTAYKCMLHFAEMYFT